MISIAPETLGSACRPFRRMTLQMAVVALMLCPSLTAPQGLSATYTGLVQVSTGDYIFNDRTTSFSFYNGFTVSNGAVTLAASIPVVLQSTPWISYSGAGLIPSGGTQHAQLRGRKHGIKMTLADTTEYDQLGVGDPTLSVNLELLREGRILPSSGLTAGLKAPLADVDRGFGTGKWDYGAGVSLAKDVGGTFVFVDVAYWVLGDLPDLELLDAVAYGIAVGQPLAAGRYAAMVSLSGYSRILKGLDPPAQVGIALNRRLSSGAGLGASLALGVTESTPDFSVSLSWQVGL